MERPNKTDRNLCDFFLAGRGDVDSPFFISRIVAVSNPRSNELNKAYQLGRSYLHASMPMRVKDIYGPSQ